MQTGVEAAALGLLEGPVFCVTSSSSSDLILPVAVYTKATNRISTVRRAEPLMWWLHGNYVHGIAKHGTRLLCYRNHLFTSGNPSQSAGGILLFVE